MKRAVIFDIDGTLADCEHRRHLVDLKNYPHDMHQGRTDWKEFFRRAKDDPVVEPVKRLLDQLKPLNHIVLCTGRGEEQRQDTRGWLQSRGISYSGLFMRPLGDYRADHVVKRELLGIIRAIYTPWLVVDDRQSVVDMWREEGLVCLQCAPGNF